MVNYAIAVNGDTVNGKTVDIHITTHGSDWYWAATATMAMATFIFIGLSYTKPRTHRIFHYITAGVTLVAAIAYFTMASNLGWTPIDVEFRRPKPVVRGINREIFYVRYVDWYDNLHPFHLLTIANLLKRFITTPLLLLDLLLTAGMPWPTILYTILLDWVMIVCGLVGALVKSSYKWGMNTR